MSGASSSVIKVPKGKVLFTFSPEHQPVVTVEPGSRLRIETELNYGDVMRSVDDRFDRKMIRVPYVNGVTGPIAIRGATPEHALVCRIEEIELVPPGVTAVVPQMSGGFGDWMRGRLEHIPWRVFDLKDGNITWNDQLRIPVQPMVGVLGTAPLIEAISTLDMGGFGGNLDVSEFTVGTTVFLPINVDGALLFIGDCHALMGDGELAAIEVRTFTTLTVDIVPRPPRMRWPRFETSDHVGTVACARPLEDAFKLSVEELVNWMVDEHGFTDDEAFMLLGLVAEARCAQVVNPKFAYVTKINKRYIAKGLSRGDGPSKDVTSHGSGTTPHLHR
jgi:acetamidase/formamidase